MKRRRRSVACLMLTVFLLAACESGKKDAGNEAEATPPAKEVEKDMNALSDNIVPGVENVATDIPAGEELYAVVSNEEDAQAIADQYGIELVEYAQGVATYHTEEDPGTVVRRGRENGWHPLAVNHVTEKID